MISAPKRTLNKNAEKDNEKHTYLFMFKRNYVTANICVTIYNNLKMHHP